MLGKKSSGIKARGDRRGKDTTSDTGSGRVTSEQRPEGGDLVNTHVGRLFQAKGQQVARPCGGRSLAQGGPAGGWPREPREAWGAAGVDRSHGSLRPRKPQRPPATPGGHAHLVCCYALALAL